MKLAYKAACIGLAILFAPGVVRSCGPFIYFARFTTYHSTFPGEFASGSFGVLRPQYKKAELLVAYRMMSGVMVSAGETPGPITYGASPDRVKPWMEARRKVPLPRYDIDPDKKIPGSDFEVFPNCLSAAFLTAADTLTRRIAAWGVSSSQVAEWVRGQDMVFGNCSGGAEIPAPLSNADPLLAADREYQTAAAEFYAGEYDKAEANFDQIAKEPASPWHDISAYVAARACIRQGTIGKNEDKLREAETRLRAIADNPSGGALNAAAQQMLGFVRARTEPEVRLAELGNEILKPRLGERLGPAITDYTAIWDSMEAARHPPAPGRAEVTDWIATFKTGGQTLGKWRRKPTTPWLLAALVWAGLEKTGGDDLKDLIAAAHAVKADSPGYATATYYGILDQIRAGDPAAAREWADQALTNKQPPQVTNLLRAERFRLARDWTEFLRFAPRTPVSAGLFEGGDDMPLTEQSKPEFDLDAAESLDSVPLALWIDAVKSTLLPRNLQAAVAQAGWVRAVILRDRASARLLAERLVELKPELSAAMKTYLAEQDAAAANFAAVFLMLRGPGFEPEVRPGWGRDTEVLKRDLLRDNWWSNAQPAYPANPEEQALADLYPDGRFGPSDFLPPDQRKTGTAEWARIIERGSNAVNYLCSEAVGWAEAHPTDSRVPQALYLAVEATHYGPSDKSSTPWSRRAFDRLHRKYPDSAWTKRTKYWY